MVPWPGETPTTRAPIAPPRRGEVYLTFFDPTVGSEIRKTRPAVILQNDVANRHSPVTIVAAMSSNAHDPYPTRVLVMSPEGGLTKNSVVVLNQIRSVDRTRLVRRMGRLSAATMARVDRALAISVGLVKL